MLPEDRAMQTQIKDMTRIDLELGEEIERAERDLEKV